MIRTHQLTRRFGDTLAVDSLDLEVKSGEVFGFLGPNGAGKTTTVRMLAALIAPTSGEAWIGDRKLGEDDQAIRASVGILTESPGLYERLSAYKNLEIFARLYGVDKPADKVEKYLRMLGLWERAGEAAGTFSKGMKQKLVIARALVHEAPVIFLDEPTAGLDPEAARVVREFIESLRGEGRTIFLTTHNLDEAERLCDRVAIFRQHLVAIDAPDALRRRLYGRTVRIRLRAVEPGVVDLVQALPFVRSVQLSDSALVVESESPDADNPVIVRALVAAGADVQYVEEVEHSLEDAYLKLLDDRQEPVSRETLQRAM
jgi:ABC-2 type transport system ATP-binding protein